MPLPPLLTRPCYCGAARDDHGRCMHCDLPTFHPQGAVCLNCLRISVRCVCCHTVYGTPAAARACENNDRAQEARRRA